MDEMTKQHNDEGLDSQRASMAKYWYVINPFKPDFTIVIFIHNKSRIAAAILDL